MKKTKASSIIDIVPYEFVNDTHAGLTIYSEKELLQCEYAGDGRYIVEYASKEERSTCEVIQLQNHDEYVKPFICLTAFTATYILIDVLLTLGVI